MSDPGDPSSMQKIRKAAVQKHGKFDLKIEASMSEHHDDEPNKMNWTALVGKPY
jgi:hypothetical protein